MEKRKDHFSDWQLPSQTSFNKREKKGLRHGVKGPELAASLHHGTRVPGLGCGVGAGCHSSLSPWPLWHRALWMGQDPVPTCVLHRCGAAQGQSWRSISRSQGFV